MHQKKAAEAEGIHFTSALLLKALVNQVCGHSIPVILEATKALSSSSISYCVSAIRGSKSMMSPPWLT
jgi:hypothetical protein